MSTPEPRQSRASRAASNGAADTVTLTMGFDEADAFTVYVAEAYAAWRDQLEQNHSANLKDLQLRALRNKVSRIRDQLPDEYPEIKLS